MEALVGEVRLRRCHPMNPLESWTEEQRSAFLYRACADAESGTVRAELFKRLAGEAEAQAAIWRAQLTARSVPYVPKPNTWANALLGGYCMLVCALLLAVVGMAISPPIDFGVRTWTLRAPERFSRSWIARSGGASGAKAPTPADRVRARNAVAWPPTTRAAYIGPPRVSGRAHARTLKAIASTTAIHGHRTPDEELTCESRVPSIDARGGGGRNGSAA